ncbi:MAG: hypothetical protein II575_14560 [Bacteroidales bacterium]|nr:hypothetical protein [Bacteroidales bacterium]
MADAVYRCAVSVATPFEWLTPFIATLFNFVEGFAVQWLAVAELVEVRRF